MKINISKPPKVTFVDVPIGGTFICGMSGLLMMKTETVRSGNNEIYNAVTLERAEYGHILDRDPVTIVECEVNVRYP